MSKLGKYNWLGIVGALALPALAVAAFELPHVFAKGQTIKSAEVNANFEALRAEIDALKTATQPQEYMRYSVEGTVTTLGGKVPLVQTTDSVGTWAPVVESTQIIPRPGLYEFDFTAVATSTATGNPATTLLQVNQDESVFYISSQRWNATPATTFDYKAHWVIRVTDTTKAFWIRSGPASTVTLELTFGQLNIKRIGD